MFIHYNTYTLYRDSIFFNFFFVVQLGGNKNGRIDFGPTTTHHIITARQNDYILSPVFFSIKHLHLKVNNLMFQKINKLILIFLNVNTTT